MLSQYIPDDIRHESHAGCFDTLADTQNRRLGWNVRSYALQKFARVLTRYSMYDIGSIGQAFFWIGRRAQSSWKFDVRHIPGVAVFPIDAVSNFLVSHQNGSGKSLSGTNGPHRQSEITTSHDSYSDGISGSQER